MEIKTSLDFCSVEADLISALNGIKDSAANYQARKMLRNLRPAVNKLGQLELQARRSPSHNLRLVNEQLELVNCEISNFEQWLIILALSQ